MTLDAGVAVTAVDPRSGALLESYPETPVGDVEGIVAAAVTAFGDPRLSDLVLARYQDEADLLAALAAFDGQLAASVFAQSDEDDALIARLTTLLTGRVGRLVFDAFPTGVAVSWAMQHGGPTPRPRRRITRRSA